MLIILFLFILNLFLWRGPIWCYHLTQQFMLYLYYRRLRRQYVLGSVHSPDVKGKVHLCAVHCASQTSVAAIQFGLAAVLHCKVHLKVWYTIYRHSLFIYSKEVQRRRSDNTDVAIRLTTADQLLTLPTDSYNLPVFWAQWKASRVGLWPNRLGTCPK